MEMIPNERDDMGGNRTDYWQGKVPAPTAPTGRGLTPLASPAPVAPKAPATVPTALKPPASLSPAATPAAPAVAPTAMASLTTPAVPASIKNPATGQTAATIGTPTGYNLNAGVDSSTQALLPTGFTLGSLTGGGTIPDAVAPSAQSTIDQGVANQQDPTNWNVTPDQTVQGQYAGLMQKGNLSIQAAEEAVTRKYAASGGRNDLMAAGAAAVAGSGVALTIASQDATTMAAAGQFNAAAANTFKQQLDQFTDNALLSKQNFDQGVAMLKDQNNAQMEQLYAQVQANAAEQSTNLKVTLAGVQAQMNATIEQMDKQFAQSVAAGAISEGYAQQNAAQAEDYNVSNAWTNYGMQVRTGYLASVSQQQAGLMQTIGQIQSNPNITAAQASAAVGDAVNEFNSFMAMNNAYYAAMVPNGNSAAASAPGTAPKVAANTYNSPAYNYTQYNASSFPKAA